MFSKYINTIIFVWNLKMSKHRLIKAISTSDTEMCIKEREQICPIHKKTRRRLNSLNFTSAML
jgi:hypothetical protein